MTPASQEQQANRVRLIEADRLEADLFDALCRRELPDRFLYVGAGGAGNWLTLSHSASFPVAERLTELLQGALPSVVPHCPNSCDVVSIGVGSGAKEELLLAALGGRVRQYVAVDVSESMVDIALARPAVQGIPSIGCTALFEDLGLISRLWRTPVLLCLLGNNLCNYEPDRALPLLHEAMTGSDLLLVDCRVLRGELGTEGASREIAAYRSAPNAMFNLGPLLARGARPEQCRFEIELTAAPTAAGTALRTRKRIRILDDVHLQVAGRPLHLRGGEKLTMGFTYKFQPEQAKGLLRLYGFEIVLAAEDAQAGNLLLLLRRAEANA